MEASAQLKWGIVCSTPDTTQMDEFIKFSTWMVRSLEESAAKLHLGHRFAPEAAFALHAEPGSKESSEACYKQINELHPEVCYVIHILPEKNSVEYLVLKEKSMQGLLVGQGVLIDNAIGYFGCYELVEVMANMNQWIGRRLAQITSRSAEGAYEKHAKPIHQVQAKTASAEQIPQAQSLTPKRHFTVKAPYKPPSMFSSSNRRKDLYQMTVTTASAGGGSGIGTGGVEVAEQQGQGTQQPRVWNGSGGRGRNGIQQQRQPLRQLDPFNTNNFQLPVEVVLHSDRSGNNTQQFFYQQQQRPASATSHSSGLHNFYQREGKEREKECIVGGYPASFNKFQIASLFSDFRPLNVQYIAAGKAIVQFGNKFHAVQVVQRYNGRKFEDEGFCLQIRTAAQEDPMKNVELAKTKLARLLLRTQTEKLIGEEVPAPKQKKKEPLGTRKDNKITPKKILQVQDPRDGHQIAVEPAAAVEANI